VTSVWFRFISALTKKREKDSKDKRQIEKLPLIHVSSTVGNSRYRVEKYCMTCGMKMPEDKPHTEEECLVAQIHEDDEMINWE
jgi:hypothetical protein